MDIPDYSRLLMNDLPWHFLLEVIARTVIMFIVILITLRASGKRGIKQLSVFELVLIIGLGSAAGDPMFYEDVGLLPAVTVFAVIIILYMFITKLTDRVRWLERLLEGEPAYLFREGRVLLKELRDSNISKEELFSELRLHSVEHLGQIRSVVLEISGELSILYYEDDDVKPGLPIFPAIEGEKRGEENGFVACMECGYVTVQKDSFVCSCCKGERSCLTLNTLRSA